MNRKLHHIIYIAISIYLLSACTRQGKQIPTMLFPELQQAEAIMYQAPDSALRLLQTMSVPPASDSLQYATWALFTTQAKYKLYMQQSDSLINIAYPYFLRHGDSQRKALALYYKAVMCKEHNNTEEAQRFCLEAAKEVEKTTDYQLGHLIYNELTLMYGARGLNEYAMIAVEKELEYAQKCGNPSYIYNSLLAKARIYGNLRKYEKAIIAYKQAVELKVKSPQNDNLKYRQLSVSISELANNYINIEEYDSALYYMRYTIKLKSMYNFKETAFDYLVLGKAYNFTNSIDSAIYYLNKVLLAPNVGLVHIADAQQNLYFAYEKKKEYKSASEICFQLSKTIDSLCHIRQGLTLMQIQEKYNQQKLINEKNGLQIQKDRVMRNALIGLLIATCAMAILIYFYQRKLRKGERQIQEAKEEANDKSLQIKENELVISRNQKRMKELTEQIEANKGLQEELEEQKQFLMEIQQQNEMLEQKNKGLLKEMESLSGTLNTNRHDLEQLKDLLEENAHLHNREWELFRCVMEQDKVLGKLKKEPHPIKEKEWEEFVRTIDQYWDNFTQRLTQAIPSITKNDLYLCCLIKLRFATPDIVILLSIEPNSVYRRKNRLKDRIIQETGNWDANMTLDLWIWNF